MFLRNDEHMGGRLGVDVFKGKYVLVLIDFFGGYLAAKNAAKKAFAIVHGSFTLAETITFQPRLNPPRRHGGTETNKMTKNSRQSGLEFSRFVLLRDSVSPW
jgi:hypothetical protein